MTLQLLNFEFLYIWGNLFFFFYQCGAYRTYLDISFCWNPCHTPSMAVLACTWQHPAPSWQVSLPWVTGLAIIHMRRLPKFRLHKCDRSGTIGTNLAVNVPQSGKNVHTSVKVASNFIFYEGNFSTFCVGLFSFELTLKVGECKINVQQYICFTQMTKYLLILRPILLLTVLLVELA